MFRRNWCAVMRPGEQRIFVEEVLDGNVCRPARVVAKRQHKLCFRLDADDFCQLARRHAAPQIIQTRPARYAVEVSVDPDRRQLHEFVERPLLRMLNQTINSKLPGCQIDFRRAVRVEHRPFLRARLSRRHPVFAPRVRADDVGFGYLVRLARVARLILWIFVETSEKTHDLQKLNFELGALNFVLFDFRFDVAGTLTGQTKYKARSTKLTSSCSLPQVSSTLPASTSQRPSWSTLQCRRCDRASRRGRLPGRARVRSFQFVSGSTGCRRPLPSSPDTECTP